MRYPAFLFLLIFLLPSCVSLKKHKTVLADNKKKRAQVASLQNKLKARDAELKTLRDSIAFAKTWKAPTKPIPQKDKYPTDAAKLSDDAYHTKDEKLVLYYMNLARTSPKQFLEKYVLPNQHDTTSSYIASLIKTLRTMQPVAALGADQSMHESALCHATVSGEIGYIGHTRHGDCKKPYSAECCAYASYSSDKALNFVILLLIDDGVPSLGHREIMLAPWVKYAGISIKPHTKYGENVVLDFLREKGI